jgi:hypothetical protein
MTTPDESLEPRTASSGTTRTPPPRTRRGAPAARPSFDDLDALDDLVNPEAIARLDTDPEPVAPTPPKSRGTRGTRGAKPAPVDPGPTPTPGSSKTFDWETAAPISTTTNRDAAVIAGAAAEVYGDPVEPEIAFEPTPATRPAKSRTAKRPERRFRQTIQKFDLWSVTKIALCFYISAMGVFVVSLVALWVVADSAGIIDNVENFIGDLFSSDNFHFVSGQVLRGAVLVGVVLVALFVAFTIIAASFYNIFAELFGGVEIVIREEEQPPKR